MPSLSLETSDPEDREGTVFLDMEVYQKNKAICTRSHIKATSAYHYVMESSAHPPSTFKAIVRAQINHAAARSDEKGPTIKAIHKMLPNRNEDIAQFTRRMAKLLEVIQDPIKYATAIERIFNIANMHIQSRLRGLPSGEADNWPRVQKIIYECMQKEQHMRNNLPTGNKSNSRQAYGHTCENCHEKSHSKRDCPLATKVSAKQGLEAIAQATPVQGQSTKRMTHYDVMLAIENIAGKITCLLDSGAEINILLAKLARKHNLMLRSTKVRNVTSFNNQTANTCGEVHLLCTLGNKGAEIPFVVCEGVQRHILGLTGLLTFGLKLNYQEDCVYDDKGNKILIHSISTSKN